MKSKFLSSLLVLAVVSNHFSDFARAAAATDDKPVYEMSEVQGSDAKATLSTHADALKKMDPSEIQSRLGASADAIDSYSADPANKLTVDQQSRFKSLSLSLRKHAADPKLKQKMLKALAHAGETSLISLAIAGSTIKQASMLPLAVLGGLIEGLVSDSLDKDNSGEAMFANTYAPAFVMLAEILFMGPAIIPGFFIMYGGFAADIVGENYCENDKSDAYAEKLCKAFKAYDSNLIDKNVDLGASAVGDGIDHGVRFAAVETERGALFIFKGTEKIAKKLFKKKEKKDSKSSS